ncbi:uncharacterized protein [Nerophis lumbriciformis]|uniref:uncharacterized protein isoform X1 n=2 Tax=Nerophis lumbriciformis TaxID=546530 RepID=UPI002ADFDF28|nr:transcription factor 20 isoform X1 [Nerophis lumbriciformis]
MLALGEVRHAEMKPIVMEQPLGSLDDLQPQDLSASNILTVIDLTKKGSLSGTSCDVQRVVTVPNWHSNSGTSNPELSSSSETTLANILQQSGDHIQPDNALSRTTVTLSYVSRSHIHADSASQLSPLYGVPPISKFSLLPPCEVEKGHKETTYALNQLYVEHVDRPVDLATQAFNSSSKAPQIDGICPPQPLCEFNGEVSSSKTTRNEHNTPGRTEKSCGLENGQDVSWSRLGVDSESSPETREGEERKGSSEILLHMLTKEEPLVIHNSVAPVEKCSLIMDYKRLLDDPVSPSPTSPDDIEDVFVLPQACSSPSGDNSFHASDVGCDDSNTEEASQLRSGISNMTASLNLSDENKQPAHSRKPELNSLVDWREDVCLSGISEDKPKTVTPYLNGNVRALQKTVNERKLRSGRGMHLESIVMNINSSRYKVSGCINTNENASKMKTRYSNATSLKRNDTLPDRKRQGRAIAKQKVTRHLNGKTNSIINTDLDTTTSTNNSKKSFSKITPKSQRLSKNVPEDVLKPGQLPQKSPARSERRNIHSKNSTEELLAHLGPTVSTNRAKCSPPALKETPKKNPRSAQGKKVPQTAKTKSTRTPKRRRKKHKPRPPLSIFSPKEPEIKLRYANYKEAKRESKLDNFSPFIHMQRQQSSASLCTLVNYPEEVCTPHKKNQREVRDHTSGFISATIPSTSCLQLGRASSHGQHQGSLVCCLCGLSANAMDLGDLHGPYYPEGYRPITKMSACTSGPKCLKDDYSDSDSSACSVRGRGGKRAVLPSLWKRRLADQQSVVNTGSPAAKRVRSEMWPTDVEDWYSPPVLPLEPCEYWLHEDCGIWSTGVFLVKGKVYGLEETVKVAHETMCSACSRPGASLGCFFKGCPSNYHYRCAMEADCVLIEENFSMKCKKHKNKTFTILVEKQSDPRRKKPC